jgi:DNA-binding MarR family transcriptional regulator
MRNVRGGMLTPMINDGIELERSVEAELSSLDDRGRPGTPTGEAWVAFLRAHASLMRVLDSELVQEANLSLSDFDVLIQLGQAEGARLRMSELARRALISRSGMTRRAGQLEERGLVARQADPTDRRSVVLALTDEGLRVLHEALPVHFRGVHEHFLDRLTDTELVGLGEVLQKVVINCDFG